MSFVECAARSFTAVSVQKNAPDSSGVYGLSNGCEWIFIGEASNIRARLMEHLSEVDTALARRSPTGFTFELCSPNKRITRQDALVRQFEPFCNRRPGYTTNRGRRGAH
jgi:excinuclease UvrABC nuclease subunit